MSCVALVIDREAPTRAKVVNLLVGAGFRVVEAVGMDDAFAASDREPVDLVVVRRHLAGQDALPLVKILRGRRPDLPILLLSGTLSPETHARALEAGVTTLVPESFVEAHFIALVKQLTQRTPPSAP